MQFTNEKQSSNDFSDRLLLRLRWLTVQRLIVIVAFLGVTTWAIRPSADPDMRWHLRTGQWIVEHRQVPISDPFAYTTSGKQWVDNGWLFQVLLYGAHRALGWPGISLLTAACVLLVLGLIYGQMAGGPFLRALVLVLTALVSAPVWTPRPALATFLLTAATLTLLTSYRRHGGRRIWLLVGLLPLWANLHAGYVLGVAVIGAFVAGEALDRFLAAIGGRIPTRLPHNQRQTRELPDRLTWHQTAAVALATGLGLGLAALNPYGPRMWTYPFYNAGQDFARRFVWEWASPDFHISFIQPLAWLLLGLLATWALSPRRARGADVLLVASFAYLTLQSSRAMGLFALVVAPAWSRALASWRPAVSHSPPATRNARLTVLNWLLLAIISFAVIFRAAAMLTPTAFETAWREAGLPVDATVWLLRTQPPRELINPYNWGGYLIWAAYPDYQVFVDGRADLHGDPFLLDYVSLMLTGKDWEATLERYGVRTALIEPQSALARALETSDSWRAAYRDDVAVVFVRDR